MANNPYVNKVMYGNNTVMDLTEDTVTPNDVLRGVTFHDKSGASQTGNLVTHNVIDNLNSDSSEDALSARMGKKVNLSSNQKVVDAVGWDGRNYFHVDDTVVSGTDNGITYTITRKNGEVTRIRCSGTPTSGDFTLWLGSWTYGGTKPILTGCPSGGGSQGTIVNYGMSAAENGGYQSVVTAGDEPAKLYEYFYSGSISVSIIIKSGYTASNLDFYPMICSEELSDYDFKAHHDSVETLLGKKQDTLTFDNTPTAGSNNPVKSSGIKTAIDTSASNVQSADIDLLKDTVGWTGKNLLPKGTPDSGNGITYSVDSNGNVIANGTASATSFWAVKMHILAGQYIMSGCPSGGGVDTYRIDIRDGKGGSTTSLGEIIDSGSGKSFTVPSDMDIYVNIRIASGYIASNLTFSPMIRKASIVDPTYEPYHTSVKQTLRDAEVIEGKNLINTPYIYDVATTHSGVTITPIENGVIKLNGTASADNYYPIHLRSGSTFDSKSDNAPLILEAGSYILTKDSSKVDIRLLKTVSGSSSTIATLYTNQSSVGFTLDTQTQVGVMVDTKNTTVYSNELLHVMIRSATESDPTFEPYYIPLKDSKFDRAEQRVLGAKNLLPYPYVDPSRTLDGITFTVNSDGSVKVNGTSTADVGFTIIDTRNSGKYVGKGKVTISKGNSNTSTQLFLNEYNGSTFVRQVTNLLNVSSYTFDNNYSDYNGILIRILIPSGTTVSNLMFYPMLRLASDPDDTYVPYAMTNKELTDSKDKWSAEATVSNGSVTFSGLDDTQGWAYEPYSWIDGNSVELNPSFTLTTISGAGTSNMTLIFSTNADSGSRAILRIIK